MDRIFTIIIINIYWADILNYNTVWMLIIPVFKFYCNKTLIDAHSAKSDSMATFEVLLSQISKYEDLGQTVKDISEFSSNREELLPQDLKSFASIYCFLLLKQTIPPLPAQLIICDP